MAAARESIAVDVGEKAESDDDAKLQMFKGELACLLLTL